MNRKQAKGVVKHFECVKAFAEGKDIQYQTGTTWLSVDDPYWDEHGTYRIAPQPLEMWVVVDKNGKLMFGAHTEVAADAALVNIARNFPDGVPYKKFRLTEEGT